MLQYAAQLLSSFTCPPFIIVFIFTSLVRVSPLLSEFSCSDCLLICTVCVPPVRPCFIRAICLTSAPPGLRLSHLRLTRTYCVSRVPSVISCPDFCGIHVSPSVDCSALSAVRLCPCVSAVPPVFVFSRLHFCGVACTAPALTIRVARFWAIVVVGSRVFPLSCPI